VVEYASVESHDQFFSLRKVSINKKKKIEEGISCKVFESVRRQNLQCTFWAAAQSRTAPEQRLPGQLQDIIIFHPFIQRDQRVQSLQTSESFSTGYTSIQPLPFYIRYCASYSYLCLLGYALSSAFDPTASLPEPTAVRWPILPS
jgi:hypothetical protein